MEQKQFVNQEYFDDGSILKMETKGWLMTLKAGDQAPSSGKRDANTVF
jgi:hypothetical protein